MFKIPTNITDLHYLPLSDARTGRSYGFTLLEVMISLAIIGGLLVTLIYTMNYHMGLAERHETITVATLLAKEKMAELEKSLNNSEGAFDRPYESYRFINVVKDSIYPGVLELTVRVQRDKEVVTLSMMKNGKMKN